MDIVIPYKNSTSNGLELRYTLRGIEKYFPNLEHIFIIGECPTFIHNIIHIPYADSPERQYKQRNIYEKLMTACADKRVSDSFAWMCDDHFLLRPFEPDYNYRATLQEAIPTFTVNQSYGLTLLNTQSILKDGFDYGHGPIVLDKEKFVRAMEFVNWNEPWGYAIKTLYCCLNGITGHQYPDLKIKSSFTADKILQLINGRPYFSIDDRGLNHSMKSVLQFLYRQKSIYEND